MSSCLKNEVCALFGHVNFFFSSRDGLVTQSQPSLQPVDKGCNGSGDLRSVAPVLPYDVDLYSWESGTVPEPLAIKCATDMRKQEVNWVENVCVVFSSLSSLHRFLGGEEREITISSVRV